MGFFSDLKEDLSQAVNELVMEESAGKEKEAAPVSEAVPEEISIPDISEDSSVLGETEEIFAFDPDNGFSMPETSEDLSRMLDSLYPDEPKETEEPVDFDFIKAEAEVPEGSEDMELSETEKVAVITEEEEPEEAEQDEVSEGWQGDFSGETAAYEETAEAAEDKGEVIEEAFAETVESMEEEPEAVMETAEEPEDIKEEIQEENMMTEEEKEVEGTEYMGFEAEDTQLQGVPAEETAVITAGMKIKGDISSQGSLDVIGSVEGNIEILGKLNITGSIEGASKAADVYAEKARINGDIHSEGSIKIGQSTIIIGNIFATSAVIAGAVKGDIDVKGPVVLDTSAIVMGNIKSKSVQINNGAVIEGLCSQCYADVNPSSFFEDIKKARK